ncbi:MAG: hypothetical protein QXM16_02310 [Nitrososphaerota archaeon]
MSGLVPPWWRVFCEPRADWIVDDFSTVLSELEKRPPNRQLLSPVVSSFIAGLLQASGGLGYLQVSESPAVFTPFVTLRCDEDTASFVVRQVGDAWVSRSGSRTVVYILGLRAVILLKVIGPYLRGFKRKAHDALISYGYKLGGEGPSRAAREHGLSLRSSIVILEGRQFRQIKFGGLRR